MSLKTALNSTLVFPKVLVAAVASAPSRFLLRDLQLTELASGPV